jgi:hypothetical protein
MELNGRGNRNCTQHPAEKLVVAVWQLRKRDEAEQRGQSQRPFGQNRFVLVG